MKRTTALMTAGSVGVVGLCLAMPALASAGSGSPSPSSATSGSSSPLTPSQKDAILGFLDDHPRLAQGLAARAEGWARFLAANPAIKAELEKVLALPADQRRAELQTWLAAHPDAKKALQAYRRTLKEHRLTQQRDRLDRRIQRLQGSGASNGAGGGSSGGSSTSPASPSLFTTT
jgi:heme-binding protein